MSGKGSGQNKSQPRGKAYDSVKYAAFKAAVEALSDASAALIARELERALSNKRMVANRDMMLYLNTACLLSFSGREITARNMSKVIRALGEKPDSAFIKVLIGSGVESHLAYVYSFYFLVANGIEPTERNILAVIRALGLKPNGKRARGTIKFISGLGD